GNAVDAALATSFALAVVKPQACGLGGDLFSLVYMNGTGKVEALNASGPAPAAATIENYRAKGLTAIPTDGPLSIALPGAVDGRMELYKKYGSKKLERLARDAIAYARGGFPLDVVLAEAIAEFAPLSPSVDASFRKPLRDLTPGRMVVQNGLADAFEQIVSYGRDGFYQGAIAKRL